MTEAQVPYGWARIPLSEIVAINPKHKDLENQTAGFVPMSLAPTDFSGILTFDERPWVEIKKGYTHFADGDVIFAKVTPCFENGKAAIVRNMPNSIGAGSTEFFTLRPLAKELSQDYIFAVIKSHEFLTLGAENMTGAVGLRRVPKQFVESFRINLPPAAEQIVIAQKLDTLLAQVENAKAHLERTSETLKRFRQSVLTAAVNGKLTEEWRGSVSVDWQTVKLLDVVKEKPRNGHSPKGVDYTTPYKNLTLSATTTGKFIDGKFKYIELDISIDSHLWVKNGDILIQRANTIEYVGVSAIYRGKDDVYVYPDLMMKCTANDKIVSEFLHYSLLSEGVRKYFRENATGTAGNMPKINQTVVSQTPLLLPSLEEQAEIVSRAEQLFAHANTIEKQIGNALARVNNLTQSILAKAFRGELTEQWRKENLKLISGENSAAALLQKIQTERVLMKPKKATKKTV